MSLTIILKEPRILSPRDIRHIRIILGTLDHELIAIRTDFKNLGIVVIIQERGDIKREKIILLKNIIKKDLSRAKSTNLVDFHDSEDFISECLEEDILEEEDPEEDTLDEEEVEEERLIREVSLAGRNGFLLVTESQEKL